MGCDACRNSQKVGMRPQSFSNGMKTGKALGTEYISSFRFSDGSEEYESIHKLNAFSLFYDSSQVA